jgi:hypothetical protein
MVDTSLYLLFDNEKEIIASREIPQGKLICTFNYSPLSKEMYETTRDADNVLRKSAYMLQNKGEEKYILCTKVSNQKDLGNYAKVGNHDCNISTNAKLVWGESQDFQRAIFLQTTRPISQGEKLFYLILLSPKV